MFCLEWMESLLLLLYCYILGDCTFACSNSAVSRELFCGISGLWAFQGGIGLLLGADGPRGELRGFGSFSFAPGLNMLFLLPRGSRLRHSDLDWALCAVSHLTVIDLYL